jgi:glutamate--cysteine ligase
MKRSPLTEDFWLQNKSIHRDWLNSQFTGFSPNFYCSIDARNSGFKSAHVDANLFPAGFNNIHPTREKSTAEAFSKYIKQLHPTVSKILIITENFTRNSFYTQNVDNLISLISCNKSYQCHSCPLSEVTADNRLIYFENNWTPDLIILNCDLGAGIPEILKQVSQPIIPSPTMGWHTRSKYNHFAAFDKLIKAFAQFAEIDEWLLSTYFALADKVNFKERIGFDNLANQVELVLKLTKEKYQQYGIKETPHVFVKADRGTFGTGIIIVKDGEEILNINKKKRHSMHVINHGIINSRLLIQEGVPTIFNHHGTAEYIYYLIGSQPCFRVIRQNSNKDNFGNLNSPGMLLYPDAELPYNAESFIAQIAALATSKEQEHLSN